MRDAPDSRLDSANNHRQSRFVILKCSGRLGVHSFNFPEGMKQIENEGNRGNLRSSTLILNDRITNVDLLAGHDISQLGVKM